VCHGIPLQFAKADTSLLMYKYNIYDTLYIGKAKESGQAKKAAN
jgi:hypothetical protein